MKNNPKYKGLTDEEVTISREKYGKNILEPPKKENIIIKLLKTLKEPMFLLLLIATSIYFLVGEYTDGLIMLLSVFVIFVIEFLQEQKTDKAIEQLNLLTAKNVKVIRNNEINIINSNDLVVGDIIILEEGDSVPADGLILETNGFATDESPLTGESIVIYKTTKEDKINHFKKNYCYEGTNVTNGNAYIKITDVGINTELGKIGKKINNIKQNKSPLEIEVNGFVLICTIISISLFSLTIIANFLNLNNLELQDRIIKSLISGITIAMATIPEEVPVILTVFLCLGALSLSQKKTLVKNNRTIETLSAMTVLCTDKTGTLTQNKMIVEETYALTKENHKIAYLACEKKAHDPMEIAIKKYTKYSNENKELKHEYIFNNIDKMVGKIWQINNEDILCVKGAYEKILPLCNISNKEEIENKVKEYSLKGYRIIAVAKKGNITQIKKKITDYKLEFCGLIALSDPPREGVEESLKKCHEANIRIIMITGDNGETATCIANNIGIINNGDYLTGEEIEKLSDKELKKLVKTVNIYARVYPEHKMRIVEALQKNGHVVGMTGDGINDAPALKKADIGISMGKRGTNVAKEASDIILLDDNFNTIITAIENGRNIYNNIKKSISYIIAIHIPIALLSLIIPILKLPNLLLPVHIVLLELLLDPTSSILFQRIKPDKDVMKTSPRNKDENIINIKTLIKCICQGLLIFIVVLSTYSYLINNNYNQDLASTISYTILLLSIILISFNLQTNKLTLSNLLLSLKDKISIIINGIIILVLILFIYLPFSHKTFNTCNLTIINWFQIIMLTMLAILPFDILKLKGVVFKNEK